MRSNWIQKALMFFSKNWPLLAIGLLVFTISYRPAQRFQNITESQSRPSSAFAENLESFSASLSDSPAVEEVQQKVAATPASLTLMDSATADTRPRMLIKNGSMNGFVDSLETAKEKIKQLTLKSKALIESENQREEYNGLVLSLTLKVPAENFQTLFDDLLKVASKITQQNIQVDDIFKQYTDIQERLKNKITLREKFRELTKKANKISDILSIEQELSRVSEDIDSTTRILKQYERDVATSTINLQWTEPREPQNPSAPLSFAKKIAMSFKDGFDGLTNTFLGIISLWPYLLIALALFFYWKRKK